MKIFALSSLTLLALTACDKTQQNPETPTSATPTPSPQYVKILTKAYAYSQSGANGKIYQYSVNIETGELTPLTTPTVSAHSYPLGLALSASGKSLFAVNYSSSDISEFTVDAETGELTFVTNKLIPTGSHPGFIEVHPKKDCAYTANISTSNISAFSFDDDTAELTHLGNVAAEGGTTAIAFSPDGKLAYAANTSASSVTSYTVNDDCTLTAASRVTSGIASPNHLIISADGKTLYVANNAAGSPSVAAFSLPGDGTLSPVAGSPFSTQSVPSYWLNLSDDGKTLYSSNDDNINAVTDSITPFAVDATTGALTAGTVIPLNWATGLWTFGSWAYATTYNQGMSAFNVDTNGVLSARTQTLPTQGSDVYMMRFLKFYEQRLVTK